MEPPLLACLRWWKCFRDSRYLSLVLGRPIRLSTHTTGREHPTPPIRNLEQHYYYKTSPSVTLTSSRVSPLISSHLQTYQEVLAAQGQPCSSMSNVRTTRDHVDLFSAYTAFYLFVFCEYSDPDNIFFNISDAAMMERWALTSFTGRIGLTAELECRVSAYPIANFRWRFKGSDITSGGRREISNEGNLGTLKITGVQQADVGDYQCLAQNEHGTLEQPMLLLEPGKVKRQTEQTKLNGY